MNMTSPAPKVIGSVLLVEKWHALGLANDLSRAGLTVYILNSGGYKALLMPKGVILLPPAPTTSEQVVSSIEAAVRAVSPDIILPVSEETLYRIWDESPSWLPLVQPVVEPDLRKVYRNKHLLGTFAQSHGVLIPQTFLLENGTKEEIMHYIDQLGLPVVVKGSAGCGGAQVKIEESLETVYLAVAELHRLTGVYPALQEYLTGATYLVGGLFDRGRPVHLIAAEKTEMYPSNTGPAVFLSSRNESELINAATNVFTALGHSGIASADFVRGSDGHFHFLEVNPRPWGSYGIARTMGVNLVGDYYRLLRGEYLPSAEECPAGYSWAKMPDYLFVPPLKLSSILRRALDPVAFSSWCWHAPHVLLYQARSACKTFQNTFF